MDLIDIAKQLSGVGTPALLILAGLGLYRKWWVPGWVYQAEVNKGIWWQNVATKALNISESILPKAGA